MLLVIQVTDDYAHIRWISNIIKEFTQEPNEIVLSEYDSIENYKMANTYLAASDFSNFTGPEKRDIFLFLLGYIIGDNDGIVDNNEQ